jgi:hypothetical protein
LPAHNGGRVAVSTVNEVDKALTEVSKELDKLPNDYFTYLIPTGGTYNCRAIAGSSARSMHGYGAAIDVSVKQSDYWRWSKDPINPIWKNRIPIEIVRVFEKRGFIWGATGITLIRCTSNIDLNYCQATYAPMKMDRPRCGSRRMWVSSLSKQHHSAQPPSSTILKGVQPSD